MHIYALSEMNVMCCLIVYCMCFCYTVDGGFSEWTQWDPCSKTCGVGERSRTRRCDYPPPLYGGQNCQGAPVEKAVCNVKPSK